MKIVKIFAIAALIMSGFAATPAIAKPGPRLITKPHALSFGKVKVGKSSHAKTVKLVNATGSSLSISPQANAPFIVSGTTCGSHLNPRERCSIELTFNPTSATDPKGTAQSGALTISDGAGGTLDSIKLVGVAVGSPEATPVPTPTPISATEAGTATALKALGGTAASVVAANKLYVGLLAWNFIQTPDLIAGFLGSG
ncbi:MAG TPA: choice-of-anchor D domain-containing protein, partial [Candidatus Binataceae bacterium]|nr:choice-of-anchor D domain-containing protein [Candidatus Binataceae bacterium]